MGLSIRGDGRNLRFESHRDLRSRAVPRGTPTAPDHEETSGLRQRKLCKEKPNLRVPSGTAHRPGWRWLARLFESQLFNVPTYPQRKFVLGRTPRRPPNAVAARRGRRLFESRRVQPKAQPGSHHDGPELRPAKARCFSLTLERTSASSGPFSLGTAASKKRAEHSALPTRVQGRQRRVAASGTLPRKAQPSCAERHLALPGVAEARALLRSAVVLLAAQVLDDRPQETGPPNGFCPRALGNPV